MPYRFVDDAPTADVGFVASGATLEECFRSAAEATLRTMIENPETLQDRVTRALHVESEDADIALLKLLEELIYHKDAESLFLRLRDLRVEFTGAHYVVDATASGEPIDAQRHRLASDVKAVTMHRLGVERSAGTWKATVVLDI